MIPGITPQPLRVVKVAFDHPDWVFELKYDGFRALALIENGRCQLISRNGNRFASFSELEKQIEKDFETNALLDGEIVCVDEGRDRGEEQIRSLWNRQRRQPLGQDQEQRIFANERTRGAIRAGSA
jgi:bifunctional non-homologous end joining protein LigD